MTNPFSGAKAPENYHILAELDFFHSISMDYMVTQKVMLMQRQQELMNEASEEGMAEEFCHFQWQLALGSAQV